MKRFSAGEPLYQAKSDQKRRPSMNPGAVSKSCHTKRCGKCYKLDCPCRCHPRVAKGK